MLSSWLPQWVTLKNGTNTHFKTTWSRGEKAGVFHRPPTGHCPGLLCGGVVGRQGWGVEEAFTFPDPCSLERWLDVKLACTDRCGEGNEM